MRFELGLGRSWVSRIENKRLQMSSSNVEEVPTVNLPVYNISKVTNSRYLATIQRNFTVCVCACARARARARVCVCVKILKVFWIIFRNVIPSESSRGKADLLLYLCILIVTFMYYCYVYSVVYILFSFRLPWLRFFRAFSSVVRQMPGYTSQRRGTVRTLPN